MNDTINKADEVRTAREDVEARFGLDLSGWHVYYAPYRPLKFSFEARMIIGYGGACSGNVGFFPSIIDGVIPAGDIERMDVVYLGDVDAAGNVSRHELLG